MDSIFVHQLFNAIDLVTGFCDSSFPGIVPSNLLKNDVLLRIVYLSVYETIAESRSSDGKSNSSIEELQTRQHKLAGT